MLSTDGIKVYMSLKKVGIKTFHSLLPAPEGFTGEMKFWAKERDENLSAFIVFLSCSVPLHSSHSRPANLEGMRMEGRAKVGLFTVACQLEKSMREI